MLYFDLVTLLTYQHTSSFFDGGFRYRVQKLFTIEGTLSAFDNTEGVNPSWTKASLLQAQAQDYQPILLNGNDFGLGKIVSISFKEGNQVQEQKYSISISAYSTGDLTPVANGVYSGIDWSEIHCIDRLDETFSFNQNEANDVTYDHVVNLKFNRDVSNLGVNPITLGKTLAANLLSSTNLSGFLGSYNSLSSAKKIYTESYNAIDFSCAVTEKTDIPATLTGTYSISFTYNLSLNEKGITIVSEKASIQGITVPIGGSANTGLAAQDDTTIFNRVNAVYTAYNWSSLSLHPIVTQGSTTNNKFEGKIEYTKSFTNDPSVFSYAIWDYTITVNRSVENYLEVSEHGSVRGIGRPLVDKYPRALAFYNGTVLSGLATRILNAYNRAGGTHSASLVLVKVGYGESKFAGTIQYDQSWTDNQQYVMTASVKKQEITVETNYPVQVATTFGIFNQKQIVQPQNNSTPGTRTVSIKLRGARTMSLSDYVAYAKGLIVTNAYQTIGTDTYMSSCNYSLNINRNDFNFNVKFSFFGFYKAFDDLTLT